MITKVEKDNIHNTLVATEAKLRFTTEDDVDSDNVFTTRNIHPTNPTKVVKKPGQPWTFLHSDEAYDTWYHQQECKQATTTAATVTTKNSKKNKKDGRLSRPFPELS